MNKLIYSPEPVVASATSSFTLSRAMKAKWVKALRSGKYKQAKEELYNPVSGGFCCLGVLCHLNGAPKRILGGRSMPDSVGYFTSVSCWKVDGMQLDRFNDEGGSFKQIASLIEKYVPTHD